MVGAGLTGIETAAEMAEQGRAVTLVSDRELAPALLKPARRLVARWLAKNRVNVLEDTRVTEARPGAVAFADGSELRSAITIWTAGFGVPDLAARSGLRTDPLGAQAVDNVLGRLAGTEPKALAVPFVGSTVGLGRRAGVLQFARRDDTPVRLFLGGRMGGPVKKAGLTAPVWGLRKVPYFSQTQRPRSAKSGETVGFPPNVERSS